LSLVISRRHSVGQLNYLSIQLLPSRNDSCQCQSQSASGNPKTVIFDYNTYKQAVPLIESDLVTSLHPAYSDSPLVASTLLYSLHSSLHRLCIISHD